MSERPGCIKNGVRYYCLSTGCECQQTYTVEDVARLQDSEVRLILKGLLRSLTEVRDQQTKSGHADVAHGLNIAIAAVRRRIR